MNIGIVLSGGMAKGAYQFGALRAISEVIPGEFIKSISGSSVGVLNGYTFATGNLQRGQKVWSEFCSDGEKWKITDVLRSDKFQSDIKYLYDENGIIGADFYCTLFDSVKREVIYKNLKNVSPEKIHAYLRASVAMPIYNKAVEIDGSHYYDGAMIDNIPVYPLLTQKLDHIICIYFDDSHYKFESSEFDSKIIKLTFPAENRIRQSVIFERESLLSMMDDGYTRSVKILKDIFCNGFEDAEYIGKKISEYGSMNENTLRVTGDFIVTNINKVTSRLAGKKTVSE